MKPLLASLLSLFVCTVSIADTWYVDADGGADFITIQSAINSANEGDEIIVMPGTYVATTDPVVDLSKNVWLHSSDGAGVTFIDGENIRRCFRADNVSGPIDNSCVIDGFTFRNGYSTIYGAGMFIEYASPTIENCVVMNCKLDGGNSSYGAGIYLDTSNSTLTNCEITGNTCEGGEYDNLYGAGVYIKNTSNPSFSDCTISDNTFIDQGQKWYYATMRGAGMYMAGQGLVLDNCIFSDNTIPEGDEDYGNSSYAGGLYVTSNTEQVAITGSSFVNNAADRGGGINIQSGNTTVSLDNTEILNNTAYSYGGGIYLNGSPSFTGCTISGNYADRNGGGVYWSYNDYPSFDTCTFSQNQSSNNSYGASIDGYDDSYGTTGQVTFSDCTFDGDIRGPSVNLNSVPAIFSSCNFTNNQDGAIKIQGSDWYGGDTEYAFNDCEFIGNGSYDSYATSLYIGECEISPSISFSGCLFDESGGSVDSSASICDRNNWSNTTLTIDTCTFIGNFDPEGQDGEVYRALSGTYSYQEVSITDSNFSNYRIAFYVSTHGSNGFTMSDSVVHANGSGASITSKNIDISNSDFINNFNGRGISISSNDSASVATLTNCTITGNDRTGIDIWDEYGNMSVTLDACEVTHNKDYGLYLDYANNTSIELQDTQLCSNWPKNMPDGTEQYIVDQGGNTLWANCLCESGCQIIVAPDGTGNFQTIEEAINNVFEGDEILVEPGTYSTIDVEMHSSVVMRSSGGSSVTTLDAGNSGRVLFADYYYGKDGEPGVIDLQGFTLTGGATLDHGGAIYIEDGWDIRLSDCVFINNQAEYGGGLYVIDSVLNLESTQFLNNTATREGGGLVFYGYNWNIDASHLIADSCVFEGNSAGTLGGGAYVDYYYDINEKLPDLQPFNISNTTFKNNTAQENGGGLYVDATTESYSGDLPVNLISFITSCTFEGNAATQNGGGLSCAVEKYGYGHTDTLSLQNTTFTENSAKKGGAIGMHHNEYFIHDSDFLVTDCAFLDNTSASYGGAIFAEVNRWDISESSFSNNSSFFGGAIYQSEASETVIQHSLFSDNDAIFGGSMYFEDCTEHVSLIDNGIYGGIASYGGAIYNRRGVIDITENRIANNYAFQGGGIFQFEGLTTISESWFGDNDAEGTDGEDSGDAIYNLISYSEIENTQFCGHDNLYMLIIGSWDDNGGNTFDNDCDDCDNNGQSDIIDIELHPELDCDGSGILDSCEIEDGALLDCNDNGVPDACDLTDGTSLDCNANSIPDECEEDCNGNDIPDDCDISDATSLDCNANNIPDECEQDCNGNYIPDDCDIANGDAEDCNNNGVPDSCDIASGDSNDTDFDEIPDECQCLADVNGDGFVDVSDILYIIADWNSTSNTNSDINNDGIVNVLDLLACVAGWGSCE